MTEKKYVHKNVKIPVGLWNAVEKLQKSGKYASDAEVIRTALRLLIEKEGIEIKASGGANE